MKGQLISNWRKDRRKSVQWVMGIITITVNGRYYGRLSRCDGVFVDVELEP